MSEELRPCPFCGAEVQDDERGEKYPRKSPMGGWIIHCECCGASLSQFRKSGKGEISWNTRPIEDALNARIAELEAERRWIPVSERLPEIEEGDSKEYDVVITYPRERSVIVAWWTYNIFDKTHQRRIWTEDQGEFGHEDITKYVTHWRERPAPPEVQE